MKMHILLFTALVLITRTTMAALVFNEPNHREERKPLTIRVLRNNEIILEYENETPWQTYGIPNIVASAGNVVHISDGEFFAQYTFVTPTDEIVFSVTGETTQGTQRNPVTILHISRIQDQSTRASALPQLADTVSTRAARASSPCSDNSPLSRERSLSPTTLRLLESAMQRQR